MKIAIYGRVSTDEQTTEQQFRDLRETAHRHGWEIVAEIADTISGSKWKREGLDALMLLVAKRKIDAVMCYKLDRIGRSLSHICRVFEELKSHGVALLIPGQGIDTRNANPAGALQLHILMAVAEFERSLISERTKLKLASLKADGKHVGRPNIRKELHKRAQILFGAVYEATRKVIGIKKLMQELGVSNGTAATIRKMLIEEAAL